MSRLANTVRWTVAVVRFVAGATVLAVESLLWGAFALITLRGYVLDVRRARRSLGGGRFHCPVGHVVPTEELLIECAVCNFRYEGSIWKCANPECGATTPFVSCPTCSRSCRNPYRFGRPT